MKQPTFSHVTIPQTMLLYLCGDFYKGGPGPGDSVLFCTSKTHKIFYSLIIKYKKLSSSLNITPIKILQRTKLVQNIILRNFCPLTFSQKINIKRDISNFSFWASNKPPFLRQILKIHIAYTLSQNKPVLHTEFHGNRFSRSLVMPAQRDTQTHTQTDRQTFIFIYKI